VAGDKQTQDPPSSAFQFKTQPFDIAKQAEEGRSERLLVLHIAEKSSKGITGGAMWYLIWILFRLKHH
jgi:hypothetical protein